MKSVFEFSFMGSGKVTMEDSLTFFKQNVRVCYLSYTYSNIMFEVSTLNTISFYSFFLSALKVMTHCVEAPADGRVGVFSLADVKSMTKFIGETFYRNYTG